MESYWNPEQRADALSGIASAARGDPVWVPTDGLPIGAYVGLTLNIAMGVAIGLQYMAIPILTS